VGLEPMVVKAHAGSAHQAIDSAVRKLKRAVASEIAKHEPRSNRMAGSVPATDDGTDEPD